jgi:hypothetical protein
MDTAMKQKTSQILYAYWNGVRGERMAPRRFEIEPARIASILPETFILERMDSDTYAYRLAGTKLCEQYGTEFRGTNFLDGWSSDDRKAILQHLAMDCQQGGVLVMTLEAGGLDRTGPSATFELTLMPLIHASTTVSRYLGSMAIIDAPDWIGSEKLVVRRLIDREIIWPDGRPHAAQERFRNQAPLLANFAGARLVKSERRTFRVLDGGRVDET